MPFMTPKDRPATDRDIAMNLGANAPSWGEAMGANAASAWDWNVLGRAQDALQEKYAEIKAYGGSNWYENELNAEKENIPKEDWPEHEHYRDGVEWDERMNPVRAKVLAEDFDERRTRDEILFRQTTGQKVAGFGVQMGIGMADPVNFIPFMGQATKLKMIGRMGSIGGRMAASGIEAGAGNVLFNPMIGADLERRGEKMTFEDYAVDTMLGTGVGILFGGAGGAWAKHFKGETKAGVLQALQKATLDVSEGRAVDVGPILKETVEANQFNRDLAVQRLSEGGLNTEQVSFFLSRLDGVAAASGMDVPTWYRKHIADVTVGGQPVAGDIRFDLAEGGEGMKVADVEAVAGRFQGKATRAMDLRVVQSFDDLPDHIKDHYKQRGMTGPVRALRDGTTKKVYMVADGFSSPDQVAAKWIHEQGVHHGLRGLVGDSRKFDGLMDQMYDHFGADSLEDIRKSYKLNFDNAAHRREAAEEMLAHIGEKITKGADLTDIERTAWDQIKVWFRDFLRERGLGMEMTDEEIAGIVKDAVQWTMGEGKKHSRLNLCKTTAAKYLKQRNKLPKLRRDFLTPYTPMEMRGWDVRMSEDGVGYVLKPDGELLGVMNSSGVPGRGVEAMLEAISKGAKRLDCVDGMLRKYYSYFGFVETQRVPWDDAQAPKGWDYATHGKPDIIFLEYPEGISRSSSDVRGRFEAARGKQLAGRRDGSPVRYSFDSDAAGRSQRGVGDQEQGASAGRVRASSGDVTPSNGSVEFLPDGRAHVRVFDGADLDQAGESLSRILSQRFNEFPPKDRLDWRTERPEHDVLDPMDGVEPEDVADELLARDMEDVQVLVESGRITEQEVLELQAADRGVEQAGRMSEAFKAAAACIRRFGL
ncbi:MAG: hypothetical protein JEY79_01000 [Pseudodesulfovibrio sp.]|nr:hypothetical protein [Pseudodesulfovibrio sp.]